MSRGVSLHAFFLLSLSLPFVLACPCQRGEFYDGNEMCQPCPHGTYMDEDNHNHPSCKSCSQAQGANEVELSSCNATVDAVIGCRDGFQRQGNTCLLTGRHVCGLGMYVQRTSQEEIPSCEVCPEGTFQNEAEHEHPDCKMCSKADPEKGEVIEDPCTKYSDSKLGCKNNFYRRDGKCHLCQTCSGDKPFVGRRCEAEQDTVCCETENMDVEDINGTPQCTLLRKRRAITQCPAGWFVNVAEGCYPCPNGTYMPKANHTDRACINCTRANPSKGEMITSECSRTKDAVIACTDGHFRFRNVSTDVDECKPCTQCKNETVRTFEGRQCSEYKDTVCCESENMLVRLGEDNTYICVPTCGPGQFMMHTKNRHAFCADCPDGTYMPDKKHDHIQCEPCSTAEPGGREKIVKKCTRTEDSVILCPRGYYRKISNPSNIMFKEPDRCKRCSHCGSYQIVKKECGNFSDTECAPKGGLGPIAYKIKERADSDQDEHGRISTISPETTEDSEKVDEHASQEGQGSFKRVLKVYGSFIAITVIILLAVPIIGWLVYSKIFKKIC